MATWPAGIEIGDSRIAAGEPITEDLMKDYRDRDDECLDYIQASAGYQNWVARNHLKSATEEESWTGASGHKELTDVDQYGFWPRMKGGGATHDTDGTTKVTSTFYTPGVAYITVIHFSATAGKTIYANFTYIQASRNHPTIWLLFDDTGGLVSSSFRPETCGYRHGWPDFYEDGLPAGWSIKVIELMRSLELREHLFRNYSKADESFLWQIHLGLLTGIITLKDPCEPLLRNMKETEKQAMKEAGLGASYHVGKTDAAPSLYVPEAQVVDFEFDPPREVKP